MSRENDVDDNKKRYRHPDVEGEILVRPGQVAVREEAGWEPVDEKADEKAAKAVATKKES